MARATRSTAATHEPIDKQPDSSPQSSRKGASKKRKRNSNAENDETLPVKQPRTDGKTEGPPGPEGYVENKETTELPSSGHVPILSTDAANILDVLEMVDTQGLLDRVFPLPIGHEDGSQFGSHLASTSTMVSLRTLLKTPSQYPLKVLQAAVKHIYPISSHPRFRPSETASQQLRFCQLASSLLDQASHNTAPIPLNVPSIIDDTATNDAAVPPSSTTTSTVGVKPHKFALVQHLPTGDWWTSASPGVPTMDGSGKELASLYTARAERVSIFPAPSGSQLARKGTLGDYVVKRVSGVVPHKAPTPRRVSCGKFLDYGPYASFAPSFDQDGVEVGRIGMGEVIYNQEMKRRLRAAVKGKRRAFLAERETSTEDVVMEDGLSSSDSAVAGPSSKMAELTKELESLLPSEEVDAIKASLGSLEMELAVDELLQRNAKALQRLEELQLQRLRAQGGGSSVVEIGSEEWDVAQGITDSLVLLASLRPRPSNGDPDRAPLIPSASALRKLQRTLPLEATEGWYGTLPEGRTVAFHDNTTLHIRTTPVAAAKSTTAPATPAPKSIKNPSPHNFHPFASGYHPSQFLAAYGAYAHGQTSYYSSAGYATSAPQATPQAIPQAAPQTAPQTAPQAATQATPQATPQAAPQATPQATPQYTPEQYAAVYAWFQNAGRSVQSAHAAGALSGHFGGTTEQPQPQRAVANTVVSSAKQQAAAGASNGATTAGGQVPTLPPHMRSAAGGAATPATPPPASPAAAVAGLYGGYYGGYVAPR